MLFVDAQIQFNYQDLRERTDGVEREEEPLLVVQEEGRGEEVNVCGSSLIKGEPCA